MSKGILEEPRTETAAGESGSRGFLGDLELAIDVCLGEQEQRLHDIIGLAVGDALPVGENGDDAAILRVQGRPYATGELVVVEGRFAFKVHRVIDAEAGRQA